jgi:hypothetical protein
MALRMITVSLSAPALNGDFAQWFSGVKVRTGSKVPVLGENPAREGGGKDQGNSA